MAVLCASPDEVRTRPLKSLIGSPKAAAPLNTAVVSPAATMTASSMCFWLGVFLCLLGRAITNKFSSSSFCFFTIMMGALLANVMAQDVKRK